MHKPCWFVHCKSPLLQADVAVLVVNATIGEFEAGFEAGGQTREHAMLVRSLGVKQLAVAVNKLDTVRATNEDVNDIVCVFSLQVHWSELRFNEIVQKLGNFLKQTGYKVIAQKWPATGFYIYLLQRSQM